MTTRYKQQCNINSNTERAQLEVFEAEPVINTIKNFVNNFESEHNERLKLEEENTYLKESNKIYREKIQEQRPVIIGGADNNGKLESFVKRIAEIKMRKNNITEQDLINYRNKVLKELES